ncbi:Hypothetical protein I595_631 [Croceitalea dokdonensis DOKDO 023]|uniref:Uncharacterized protein n=1 Tax=Croceitalea dokdonensis DOKDO 023 TaxID=1300341 RepID=A0A0P7AZL5_9FLAO|nr:Hypothetical protein I595_631 [Croceitalea dokdonensis DOKDO 023]
MVIRVMRILPLLFSKIRFAKRCAYRVLYNANDSIMMVYV